MPGKRRKTSSAVCQSTGKPIYRDRIAAELSLEKIQRFARRTVHSEKRSYECEFCHRWHLTSQDADPGRRFARSA